MIAKSGRCLHHLAKLWVARYRERHDSIDDPINHSNISSKLLLTWQHFRNPLSISWMGGGEAWNVQCAEVSKCVASLAKFGPKQSINYSHLQKCNKTFIENLPSFQHDHLCHLERPELGLAIFLQMIQKTLREIWKISVIPEAFSLDPMTQHVEVVFCWIGRKEFEVHTTLFRSRVLWQRPRVRFSLDTFNSSPSLIKRVFTRLCAFMASKVSLFSTASSMSAVQRR